MGHKRTTSAATLHHGDELTRDCVGIGIWFAAPARRDANIEDTLLAASSEGMERDDLRMLAMLVTWIGIHHERIHADRMVRAVAAHPSPRVRAFWAGIATWLERDRRLAKLIGAYSGLRIDLLREGTDFQVRRRGEDERFAGGPLRVPAGVLRDRPEDVLPPAEVAKKHRTYRWRTIIGPSYRADLWAALEAEPELTAAELARRTYASFASAWQVKRDAALLEVGGRATRQVDPSFDATDTARCGTSAAASSGVSTKPDQIQPPWTRPSLKPFRLTRIIALAAMLAGCRGDTVPTHHATSSGDLDMDSVPPTVSRTCTDADASEDHAVDAGNRTEVAVIKPDGGGWRGYYQLRADYEFDGHFGHVGPGLPVHHLDSGIEPRGCGGPLCGRRDAGPQ